MSTRNISPLRQRMIDDMTARKLNPQTQKGSHQGLQAVRRLPPALSGDRHCG
jgi:hypothetical protein